MVTTLKDLTPDPKNRRRHTSRNVEMITEAIETVGTGRSIVIDEDDVVLAGNATVKAAGVAGLTKLKIVEAEGDEVIAVRRRGLSSEQKRALALYDNRTAELAEWDVAQLVEDVEAGLGVSDYFNEEELQTVFEEGSQPSIAELENAGKYSSKIKSPIYTPTGAKPVLSTLYDDRTYQKLVAAIRLSALSQPQKDFLIIAAHRHIVFDYSKVAEYYSHSETSMQGFMEDSALVIIDFDQAIEKGFVKLYKEFQKLAKDDQY